MVQPKIVYSCHLKDAVPVSHGIAVRASALGDEVRLGAEDLSPSALWLMRTVRHLENHGDRVRSRKSRAYETLFDTSIVYRVYKTLTLYRWGG